MEHVSGRASLVNLDEVGVLIGHRGTADPQPFASGAVDEASCAVTLGIGEHRAGVLSARLIVATPLNDLGHRRLTGTLVAGRQRKTAADDEFIRTQRAPAIPEMELVGGNDASLPHREVDDVGVDHRTLHVGPVASGIHPNGTADRSRHADSPLETGQAVPDGRAGNDRQLCRCADDDGRLVDDADAGIVAGHVNHEPIEASIGNEHVAAPSEGANSDAGTGDGRRNGTERLVVVDHDHGRSSASDPIGGEGPHGNVDGDLVTEFVHQPFDH